VREREKGVREREKGVRKREKDTRVCVRVGACESVVEREGECLLSERGK
jgi:hypothetical protein